ncbi:MAG: hypothetical protein R6W90_16820 [Ignavibacteriaceae bacterium]
MKPLVCVYCEGTDTKLIVVEKEKDKIKVIKSASFDFVSPTIDLDEGVANLNIEGDEINFEGTDKSGGAINLSSQTLVTAALRDVNLNKHLFIPALTEPAIYYHVFEGAKLPKTAKITQEIVNDIQATKNVVVDKENLGYIELADKSLLSVFLTGEVPCINLINSLARYNGKRYYKIPSVKSAEISLAYYAAKRKKFFPDDHSLIVYIGKENSKLIFLQGRKLKHIGTTLDIGTLNLHTYDVYFSKILLEMENGGISSLDNIVVCGEDDSENLILSFYGTFPEANVSRLEFDDLDLSLIDSKTKEAFSAFSVPAAVAAEYYDELSEEYQGINLLPKYVREDQKAFQFAWHGYAMFPLLFLAAFYITLQVLENNRNINRLDTEIAEQTVLLRQNQEMLGRVSELEGKISGFDQTQAILDSAAAGTGIWSDVLADISSFFNGRKNIWLIRLQNDGSNEVNLEGYALSKKAITDFAYAIGSAELKKVNFEALRDANTYKFNITFNLSNYPKVNE